MIITNFEKIGKSTYQAIALDGCKENEIIIKKNNNTFMWDTFINGIYKHSHEGLKWAKVWLAMQGV